MVDFPPVLDTLLQTDERWAGREEAIFGMLWFEFLAVSPSYELARKRRTGTLNQTDQARLPSDFDNVLAVYDDLGDVQRISFDDWWIDRGFRFFGYQGEKPRVGPIDVLVRENCDPLNTLMTRADAYLKGRWREQGQQPSAILAIPLGLSKSQIANQITYLLSLYDKSLKSFPTEPPKYKPLGKKRDTSSLFRYLNCVTVKSYHPELKLHEIGTIADLSSTYSARLQTEDSIDDRHALKILTSRAISRGMMIAENAARGVFPSYMKVAHAVKFDWPDIGEILESRQDWLDCGD